MSAERIPKSAGESQCVSEALRILIVDDSAAVRGIWKKVLTECAGFQVVGLAENGKRGVDLVAEVKPDLVLLDIEMPVMDGLTALPLLLKAHPGVRVIMASSLTHQSSSAAIHALALGAADYIGKPSSTSLGVTLNEISQELIAKIRNLKYPTLQKRKINPEVCQPLKTAAVSKIASVPMVIVIGCSTGGPNALLTVLNGIDFEKMRIPIVIVQHMPAFFINLLAERVTKETRRECRVISGGEVLKPGFIGIAPGDFHVEIIGTLLDARLRLTTNPPENFCRPAVDPLFRSASQVFSNQVLGVVLTGMGEDGKNGCVNICNRGGSVIVQDEESSVVWGMPGAVAKAGLAQFILPLQQIATSIQSVCHTGGTRA